MAVGSTDPASVPDQGAEAGSATKYCPTLSDCMGMLLVPDAEIFCADIADLEKLIADAGTV